MYEHVVLFLFLILLFAGSWFIFYLKQVQGLYQYGFIKAIIVHTIAVLIVHCLQFCYVYIRKNIQSEEFLLFADCLQFTANIGIVFTYYLMVNIFMSFREKPFSKTQNTWALLIASLLIFAFLINVFVPETQFFLRWTNLIKEKLLLLNIIAIDVEILTLIGFYFIWINPRVNTNRIKISKSLASSYLFVDVIIILFVKYIDYAHIQGNVVWALLMLFNLILLSIPVIWVKLVFLKYAEQMSNLINGDNQFNTIYNKYKISKRETEIIELLIDGKSTNEIKEDLFLSYHTVKNHISHIYEKLNVRTRHELIHFFVKMK